MSKTFCCSSSWTTIAETERFERSHQLLLTLQFSKLLTSPNGGLHFQNTIFYNFQVCFFICCKYSFSGRKTCRSPYLSVPLVFKTRLLAGAIFLPFAYLKRFELLLMGLEAIVLRNYTTDTFFVERGRFELPTSRIITHIRYLVLTLPFWLL